MIPRAPAWPAAPEGMHGLHRDRRCPTQGRLPPTSVNPVFSPLVTVRSNFLGHISVKTREHVSAYTRHIRRGTLDMPGEATDE